MPVRLLRRLTGTAFGRPLGRCLRQKGVPSPSNSPILPKTRALERFNFEKGETRGGGTTPPGQKCAFSAKRQAVWFKMPSVSNCKCPNGHELRLPVGALLVTEGRGLSVTKRKNAFNHVSSRIKISPGTALLCSSGGRLLQESGGAAVLCILLNKARLGEDGGSLRGEGGPFARQPKGPTFPPQQNFRFPD